MTKADKPLGDEKFVLSSVKGFNPDANTGRKVEARGLLYAGGGGSRLDSTAMQTLSETLRKLDGPEVHGRGRPRR